MHFVVTRTSFVQSPMTNFVLAVRPQNRPHAQPTEFMPAVDTLHVVAAFILLNGHFTLRTRLRVFRGPLRKAGISGRVFLLPGLVLFACEIGVPLLFAIETKAKAAAGFRAAHQGNRGVADHRSPAPGIRAPATLAHLRQGLL